MAEPRGQVEDALLARMLEEALFLAERTRGWILHRTSAGGGESLEAALVHSLLLSRLTSRITATVAWLLARRAVREGELSWEQARTEPTWRLLPLEGPSFRADHAAPADGVCDPELAALDRAARELYARAERLDRELGSTAGSG